MALVDDIINNHDSVRLDMTLEFDDQKIEVHAYGKTETRTTLYVARSYRMLGREERFQGCSFFINDRKACREHIAEIVRMYA
jgi:hypothetical protein